MNDPALIVAIVALAVAIYSATRKQKTASTTTVISSSIDKFAIDDRIKDAIDKHVVTMHRGQHQ